MGIEFNKWNKPVAYYLLTSHPGEIFKKYDNNKQYQRITANEIIHGYILERPSQSRGVPMDAQCHVTSADAGSL